jgi:hypothetical protein
MDTPYRRFLGAVAMIIMMIVGGLGLVTAMTTKETTRPALTALEHASCSRPEGIRGGINITNYILCGDGTRIPLNGATGRNARRFGLSASDEAYRCALAGHPIEVWTYQGGWPRSRILQVSCNGVVTVAYGRSAVPPIVTTTVPRLAFLILGLFSMLTFFGFLTALTARQHGTSSRPDWHWPD